jgi:hypothetical protein
MGFRRRPLSQAIVSATRILAATVAGTFVLFAVSARADVTISAGATRNMACAGGVCSPTAKRAVLNVTDLENLLASGNVTVTTTGSSNVQAHDIHIVAAVSWQSGSTLTLNANESIADDKSMAVEGTGSLAILTNDGGSGGVLSFGAKGHVTFADLSSVLTINGTPYVLVDDIASLAGDIAANPKGDFALANSYDAKADGIYTASPIATTFSGIFEGLGNTISNL